MRRAMFMSFAGLVNTQTLVKLVFVISILLRISLSLVNQEANDDHFEVIDFIKQQAIFPDPVQCWECSQPKLYHSFAAACLKFFPLHSRRSQVVFSQLVSCFAGIITIYIVWLFIKSQNVSDKLKFICFSLVALNPRLIAINVQAANDSFVILFSTLALYFGYHFFRNKTLRSFLGFTVFAVFSGLSKVNGFVVFFWGLAVFILKLAGNKRTFLDFKKAYLIYLFIFLIVFLSLAGWLGEYWQNYRSFGSPFIVNYKLAPYKGFYVFRPGTLSVLSSFFTFRLVDLIKNPITTDWSEVYPLHRTSLWSQVYGRAHFILFDNWPPSWRIQNKMIIDIGRVIFVLALFPSLILLLGIIKETLACLRSFIKDKFDFLNDTSDWIFCAAFFGYFFFMLLLNFLHRDFSFMKAIYIYPGLLAFIFLFLSGGSYIYTLLKSRPKILFYLDSVFGMLFSFYVLTILSLIFYLFRQL
ncbi:MAG: glycosyltransferase family 39 protein [Candidatus Omnitrophica bacterium]|nr:glycosyltransferase family 39 protein [Candidatus Omnitrophota bacterium]